MAYGKKSCFPLWTRFFYYSSFCLLPLWTGKLCTYFGFFLGGEDVLSYGVNQVLDLDIFILPPRSTAKSGKLEVQRFN